MFETLKYDISQDPFFKEGIARGVRPFVLDTVKEAVKKRGINGLGNLSSTDLANASLQKIERQGLGARGAMSELQMQQELIALVSQPGLSGFLSDVVDKAKSAVKKVTRPIEKVASKVVGTVAKQKFIKDLPGFRYVNDKNTHKQKRDHYKKLWQSTKNKKKKREYRKLYEYHAQRYKEKSGKIRKAATIAATAGAAFAAAPQVVAMAKAGASKALGVGKALTASKTVKAGLAVKDYQDKKKARKKAEKQASEMMQEYNQVLEEMELENLEGEPTDSQVLAVATEAEQEKKGKKALLATMAIGVPGVMILAGQNG